MSLLSKKEREELNALSKEVFGSSSRWQKLVEKGYVEEIKEEKEEVIPAEKEGEEPTTQKVMVPVLNENGVQLTVLKRHTVDSVRELLTNHKKQLDEIRAMIKKQQEEAKAKEEAEAKAKELHQTLSGSAI